MNLLDTSEMVQHVPIAMMYADIFMFVVGLAIAFFVAER